MGYVALGTRGPFTGTVDTTGNNPGNWTVVLDQKALVINFPYYEIYRITLTGRPGSRFTMSIDQKQWEVSQAGDYNSWEAFDGLLLQPSNVIYFYWSNPVTDNYPPTVTVFLRADTAIPANAAQQIGTA